jgi:hypothetical protein
MLKNAKSYGQLYHHSDSNSYLLQPATLQLHI